MSNIKCANPACKGDLFKELIIKSLTKVSITLTCQSCGAVYHFTCSIMLPPSKSSTVQDSLDKIKNLSKYLPSERLPMKTAKVSPNKPNG